MAEFSYWQLFKDEVPPAEVPREGEIVRAPDFGHVPRWQDGYSGIAR